MWNLRRGRNDSLRKSLIGKTMYYRNNKGRLINVRGIGYFTVSFLFCYMLQTRTHIQEWKIFSELTNAQIKVSCRDLRLQNVFSSVDCIELCIHCIVGIMKWNLILYSAEKINFLNILMEIFMYRLLIFFLSTTNFYWYMYWIYNLIRAVFFKIWTFI